MRETAEAFDMTAIWKTLDSKWGDFKWKSWKEVVYEAKESHWLWSKGNGSNTTEDI